MISGIFAIATAIWYFNTARAIGKNKWVWAAVGFVGFQGAFNILVKFIVFPISLFTPSVHNDSLFHSMIWLIATALTVVVVMFIRTNYLKGTLVARDSVKSPLTDSE